MTPVVTTRGASPTSPPKLDMLGSEGSPFDITSHGDSEIFTSFASTTPLTSPCSSPKTSSLASSLTYMSARTLSQATAQTTEVRQGSAPSREEALKRTPDTADSQQQVAKSLFGTVTTKDLINALSTHKKDQAKDKYVPKEKGDAGYNQKITIGKDGKLQVVPRTWRDTINDIFSFLPGRKTTREESIHTVLQMAQKDMQESPQNFDQKANITALKNILETQWGYLVSKEGANDITTLIKIYLRIGGKKEELIPILSQAIEKKANKENLLMTDAMKKRVSGIINHDLNTDLKLNDEENNGAKQALKAYIFLETITTFDDSEDSYIIQILKDSKYKRDDVVTALTVKNFGKPLSNAITLFMNTPC